MRYAEAGFNLEIDLTRGNIEKVSTDPKLTETYLGGQGTAAKILWDRVPPEIEPFSPDNLLIFSTGLPLRCDMCESDPPLEEPWCVKVCGCDALTYKEREQEVTYEKENYKDIEIGLASLADKYGMDAIMDAIIRRSKKN